MPTATPSERRFVAALLSAGGVKGAAALLGMSPGNLANRLFRARRRHGVSSNAELAVRISGSRPAA